MKYKRRTYEVAVVGGGIAGIAAALSSARQGAKTLLVENSYMLGGLATSGLVTIYLPLCDGAGNQTCFSIAEELLKLSIKHGAEGNLPTAWLENGSKEEKIKTRYQVQYNPHIFAIEAEKLLIKNGVKILYGGVLTQAKTDAEGKSIRFIEVATRSDRYKIYAKSFVDCTGDATLCEYAGAQTRLAETPNALAAWYYETVNGEYNLVMRGACDSVAQNGANRLRYKGFGGIDGEELSKSVEKSHSELLSHFLKKGGDSRAHALSTIATIPQVRMTRMLVGKTAIQFSDDKRAFPDSVGAFGYWLKRGYAFELPAGTLYGEIRNLTVAGRCISVADADIWDATRVIPVCAVSGEAAGLIAATTNDISKLNIKEIQSILKNRGVMIHLGEK